MVEGGEKVEEFESIYRTYFRDVFLYVKGLCRNEALAEEITAETFWKALRTLEQFQGTCEIRVWLCQIAKNCYFSYLRKNKNTVDPETVPELTDDFDLLSHICNSEAAAEALRIVHNLGEPQKEVFLLRVFGELSFKQIARLFHKNENWACVTYHRAKAKIKKRMEANDESDL